MASRASFGPSRSSRYQVSSRLDRQEREVRVQAGQVILPEGDQDPPAAIGQDLSELPEERLLGRLVGGVLGQHLLELVKEQDGRAERRPRPGRELLGQVPGQGPVGEVLHRPPGGLWPVRLQGPEGTEHISVRPRDGRRGVDPDDNRRGRRVGRVFHGGDDERPGAGVPFVVRARPEDRDQAGLDEGRLAGPARRVHQDDPLGQQQVGQGGHLPGAAEQLLARLERARADVRPGAGHGLASIGCRAPPGSLRATPVDADPRIAEQTLQVPADPVRLAFRPSSGRAGRPRPGPGTAAGSWPPPGP